MTDLDAPVVRRTNHVVKGRRIIGTMTPGGVHVRLERTQQGGHVDWDVLWKWIEQSQIAIKPRKV
jgi:hypothetical protein